MSRAGLKQRPTTGAGRSNVHQHGRNRSVCKTHRRLPGYVLTSVQDGASDRRRQDAVDERADRGPVVHLAPPRGFGGCTRPCPALRGPPCWSSTGSRCIPPRQGRCASHDARPADRADPLRLRLRESRSRDLSTTHTTQPRGKVAVEVSAEVHGWRDPIRRIRFSATIRPKPH